MVTTCGTSLARAGTRVELADFEHFFNLFLRNADGVAEMGELIGAVDLLLLDARDIVVIETLQRCHDGRPETVQRNRRQNKNGNTDQPAHGAKSSL